MLDGMQSSLRTKTSICCRGRSRLSCQHEPLFFVLYMCRRSAMSCAFKNRAQTLQLSAQTKTNQGNTMSIPTSESKPDGLHRAPSKQSRHVRQALSNAGPSQLRDFINDLIRRNQLNPGFFLQLLLSLVFLGFGLIADLPLLVVVAAVVSPVLNPMIGLVISAIKPSTAHLLKSASFLLITLLAFFGLGWLINLSSPGALTADQINGFFSLNNGWLEWVVLVLAAIISAYLFLYRAGGPSVVTSTVFVFLIFIPLTLAGLLFSRGEMGAGITLLITIAARLFISILLMMITVWVLGFSPRGTAGWLLIGMVLILSALAIAEMRFDQFGFSLQTPEPAQIAAVAPTSEHLNAATPTVAPTKKPTVAPTPTEQILPTPTSLEVVGERYALVVSESGVVVRESASTDAAIVTYISNGLQVTLIGEQVNAQNMDWQQVIAPDGKEGWVAARFLSEITP